MSIVVFIVIAAVVAAAILFTGLLVSRDGYRRLPDSTDLGWMGGIR